MTHLKLIIIIALNLSPFPITPNLCAGINVVSETIMLDTPNCTISDLRNKEDRRGDNENIRTKIIMENCFDPLIPSASFADLNNIVSIQIVGSNVNWIEANAFDNLNLLEWLSLTDNNLTTLQQWCDQKLDNVNTLDLHRNAIRELNVNGLWPYPNLARLSLANNLIADIPTGFFGKTSNIQTLHLDGNSIRRIEGDTFKPLLRLEHLHLEFNDISSIDELAFVTLAHLKTLRLDGNRLDTLGPALFFALPRLEQLNLSQNALHTLSMDFESNAELKSIDLSYNSLTAIESDSVYGVHALEVRNQFEH